MINPLSNCKRAIFCLLNALLLIGCQETPTTSGLKQVEPDREISTPGYFEKVLAWDSNENRWIFFSWQGTLGANGCKLPINVHDDPQTVPSNFNATDVKNALRHGSAQWRNAIRAANIECETAIRFESEGQTMFTNFPRIDIYFDEVMAAGAARGNVLVNINANTHKFHHVKMRIATTHLQNGPLATMTREDYFNTFAHEFGHAYGIYCFDECQGHSPNSNDVMFTPGRYSSLSDGDKSTIVRIMTGNAFYKP